MPDLRPGPRVWRGAPRPCMRRLRRGPEHHGRLRSRALRLRPVPQPGGARPHRRVLHHDETRRPARHRLHPDAVSGDQNARAGAPLPGARKPHRRVLQPPGGTGEKGGTAPAGVCKGRCGSGRVLRNPRHLRRGGRDRHLREPDHRVDTLKEAGVVACKPDDRTQPDDDRAARGPPMLQTRFLACDPHCSHVFCGAVRRNPPVRGSGAVRIQRDQPRMPAG